MKMLNLIIMALLVTDVASPSAQQPQQNAISSLDRELWMATLQQIQREQKQPLALLNETYPAEEIQQKFVVGTNRDSPIVLKSLRRNESPVRIAVEVPPGIEVLEVTSVRKKPGSQFDMDAIRAQKRRVIRLSLPVLSDDGTQALIFSWTAAGFNDSSGAGYVFEKRQGEWVVVNYIAAWIT